MTERVQTVVLPAADSLGDWSAWAQRSLAEAGMARAQALHVDFADRCPIDVRALAVVQGMVARWSDGEERLVRLEGLQPAVLRAVGFLGMCATPDAHLPLTASVDPIGRVLLLPAAGLVEAAFEDRHLLDWLDGIIVDEVQIDLRHLSQIGSRFIDWLLRLQARVPAIELVKVGPRALQILKQFRLDELFAIRPQTGIVAVVGD